MLLKPLPLLAVFTAGCLSGAVFIALWRVDSADVPTSGVRERAMQSDAFRTAQQQLELVIQRAVKDDRSAPRVEPASQRSEHFAGESPTEPGTSVADALSRLEAAYREGIATARQSDTPNEASTISDAPSPELPVREETAVAVAHTAPPPETVPRADAPTERDPQTDVQVLARRDDAPPRYLYEGDVNQNVQVGNVHQGDVNNVQQVVVLQYLQLLTVSPLGQHAWPAHKARRESKRHTFPFSASLTTPNNPWGGRRSAARLGHVKR
jgi:hypothetical protein